MTLQSEYFDCAGKLNGRKVPRYWRDWTPYKRSEWLKEQGIAEDALEAMEILQAAGEWETEAEDLPPSRETAVNLQEPSRAELIRQDRLSIELRSSNSRRGWADEYENY